MNSTQESRLCRLCLDFECELLDVFENNEMGIRLYEVIEEYFEFKVCKGGIIPWLVCTTCAMKLRDFKNFKEQAVKYNTILETVEMGGGRSLRKNIEDTLSALEDQGSNGDSSSEKMLLVEEEEEESIHLHLESDSEDEHGCQPGVGQVNNVRRRTKEESTQYLLPRRSARETNTLAVNFSSWFDLRKAPYHSVDGFAVVIDRNDGVQKLPRRCEGSRDLSARNRILQQRMAKAQDQKKQPAGRIGKRRRLTNSNRQVKQKRKLKNGRAREDALPMPNRKEGCRAKIPIQNKIANAFRLGGRNHLVSMRRC